MPPRARAAGTYERAPGPRGQAFSLHLDRLVHTLLETECRMLLCWPGFYELSLREENLFFVFVDRKKRGWISLGSGRPAEN